MPEDEGYRLIKSPGAGEVASASQRAGNGTQIEGASKVSESERQAKRFEMGDWQS